MNTKLVLMFFLIGAIFSIVIASNSNIKDLTEEEFDEKLESKIFPFIKSGDRGSFVGSENAIIEYFKYVNRDEIGSIIILPGRAGFFLKFQEVMYEFASKGYSVYSYDHRGQGFSSRLLKNRHKGHVGNFQHYIDDLGTFIDEVVQPNSPKNIMLFAHSLGGLIAAGFMEQYSDAIDKAVLSSPMFEMNTKPAPKALAKAAAYTLIGLGQGFRYVPGGGDAPDPNEIEFDKIVRDGTGSVVRFNRLNRDISRDHPEVMIGAPTNWWLKECFEVTSRYRKRSILRQASKVKTPVLLFQAGDDDWVKPKAQNKFCDNAVNCVIKYIPESRHETWLEREGLRVPYMEQVLNFFGG
jgi:lysophospholipase